MRESRLRSSRHEVAIAARAGLFGVWPEVAPARFGRGGGLGAGSTVQGDILRGEEIAAWGFGQDNLATATATSIYADTSR